ncbi:MAG: hypothetical protein BWY54_00683 [Candidatus Dependentiae bacterium ADurb.Bin331]|nr:MAG: hypothetical protein BWY54_00683 [Candidatus Dependentiae bacterium ADurb.Bin331]
MHLHLPKKIFFFLLSASFAHINAMEKTDAHNCTSALSSYAIDFCDHTAASSISKQIQRLTKNNFCYVLENYLTDNSFILSFQEALKNGAQVNIIIDANPGTAAQELTKKNIKSLATAGATIYLFNKEKKINSNKFPTKLHTKAIIWTNTHDELTSYNSWFGSRNLSKNEQHEKNGNCMLRSTIPEIYQQIFNHFTSLITFAHQIDKNGNIIAASKQASSLNVIREQALKTHRSHFPQTIMIDSSLEYNINASIATCFKDEQITQLYISVFNIDDFVILNSLEQAARKGVLKQLIIDGSAFNYDVKEEFKKNTKRSVSIKQLMANEVDVRIFNPQGSEKTEDEYYDALTLNKLYAHSAPIIAHEKLFFAKKKDDSTLVGLGSANFTYVNNHDVNFWAYIPNQPQFASTVFDYLQETAKKSSPLSKLLRTNSINISSFFAKKRKSDNISHSNDNSSQEEDN